MDIIAAAASPATAPPADAVAPVRAEHAPPPGEALPSHYRLCVGCGPDHDSGLHLCVVAGEGVAITGEFVVSEHHQGAPGLAHGGMLATALDEAMGALNWLLMKPAVTGRLEIDFCRPVPVGSTLHLSAQILAVSGRKVYSVADGRLGQPSGPVAVSARGLFLQVGLEHFQQHGRPQDVQRASTEKPRSARRPWLEINP